MNSIIREVKINSKVLLIIALILSVGITAYFTVSLHFILSNDFNSLLQINIHSIIKTIIENYNWTNSSNFFIAFYEKQKEYLL